METEGLEIREAGIWNTGDGETGMLTQDVGLCSIIAYKFRQIWNIIWSRRPLPDTDNKNILLTLYLEPVACWTSSALNCGHG